MLSFQDEILQGVPEKIPAPKEFNPEINHAPKRKQILSNEEKKLALKNALRYFPRSQHVGLIDEFHRELEQYGRIYMYRYRPEHEIYARPIDEYPGNCEQAKAIMLMIQNNLHSDVAQHPHELITYGGNGAVFQNWIQYRLTMKYLAEMTDEQTLVMNSGHPQGLFPSHKNAPRVVVSNGMVIPNYSSQDHWEKFNALGVTQYGQMTAGSYMYIGPQGIVHGTTITVLNAIRKIAKNRDDYKGKLFVTAGLGGMSGAQPKAGNIAGVISVTAEVNPKAAKTRHEQGWVDEIIDDLGELCDRVKTAKADMEVVSIAYLGNIVEVWEKFEEKDIYLDSAFYYLGMSDKNFTSHIQYFYLKEDQRGLINFVMSNDRINELDYANNELALAYSRIAEIFSENNIQKESETYHKKAIELMPLVIDYKIKYGSFLFKNNRIDESKKQYLGALDLNPTIKEIHMNLGLIALIEGKYLYAKNSLKQAILLDPDYILAFENLVVLSQKEDDLSRTKLYLQKILEIDPNHQAKQLLKEL